MFSSLNSGKTMEEHVKIGEDINPLKNGMAASTMEDAKTPIIPNVEEADLETTVTKDDAQYPNKQAQTPKTLSSEWRGEAKQGVTPRRKNQGGEEKRQ